MTYWQPSLASIGPEMSPVYAPDWCGDRSCAPYPSSSRSPSIRVCTLRMSTNGGRTTTSTSASRFSGRLNASFWVSAIASRWLRFIFQLPASNGRRGSLVATSRLQGFDAGKGLALQVLQGGAAAGRDVPEGGLVEAELPDRGRGVPAADDGEPVDLGDRLGHAAGTGGERRELQHPHRPVPQTGLPGAQNIADAAAGF